MEKGGHVDETLRNPGLRCMDKLEVLRIQIDTQGNITSLDLTERRYDNWGIWWW